MRSLRYFQGGLGLGLESHARTESGGNVNRVVSCILIETLSGELGMFRNDMT